MFFSVPPIRAKIVREWSFFNAGQAYNVSCQVLGSRPPAVTAIYVGPSQLREVNYHVSIYSQLNNFPPYGFLLCLVCFLQKSSIITLLSHED